ncbi:formate dehydrogenase accessory sulfurtransferase FdhD [Oecophyllibacter saccharovorans]|nr:formate dehydrogenase accessory sulfurtransferase FdhD [Oecophyllibacter saccharovorans]
MDAPVAKSAPLPPDPCGNCPESVPPVAVEVGFLHVGPQGQGRPERRCIATETPVQIVFNGVLPYAVMMVTPADLEDFARGFVLSERLLESPEELSACRIEREGENVILQLTVAQAPFRRLLLRRGEGRSLSGRTGCGVCGLETTDLLDAPLPPVPAGGSFTLAAIRRGLRDLRASQVMNAEVRMLHAAAWTDREGKILLVREDVGRHNALDKLIGALQRAELDPAEGICLLTSRCSFEMAQKAVLAGMRCLVAVSAPTARAVTVARQAGLTLVAQAREEGQNIFCGSERLSDLRLAAPPSPQCE